MIRTLQGSAAASGWAGWALAHPEFGSSVNPITTRGADYALHITATLPGSDNLDLNISDLNALKIFRKNPVLELHFAVIELHFVVLL